MTMARGAVLKSMTELTDSTLGLGERADSSF
jgi:hypothetical protein